VADLRLFCDELKLDAVAAWARRRWHGRKCGSDNWNSARSSASGTNFGAKLPKPWAGLRPLGVSWLRLQSGWPRRPLGPGPLRRAWPWLSSLPNPPKPWPRSNVPEPKVCFARFVTSIQLHSSTCV
jgi:hypothetical protein